MHGLRLVAWLLTVIASCALPVRAGGPGEAPVETPASQTVPPAEAVRPGPDAPEAASAEPAPAPAAAELMPEAAAPAAAEPMPEAAPAAAPEKGLDAPAPEPEAYPAVADAFQAGRLEVALDRVVSALGEDPENVDLLEWKGRILRRGKDHRAAVETYEALLELEPEHPSARPIMAMLSLQLSREADDADRSVQWLGRAAEYGGALDPALRRTYIERLWMDGRTAEAVRALESVPAGQSVPNELLLSVADLCREDQLYQNAEKFCGRVLEREADNRRARLGLALAVHESGEHQRALDILREALVMHPGHVPFLVALGGVEAALDKRYAAIKTYGRALELAPQHTTAASQRAALLLDLGCISLAREFVDADRARIRPDVQKRLAMLEDVQAVRQTAATPDGAPAKLVLRVLCYHDIPTKLDVEDPNAVLLPQFIDQLEYLRRGGFRVLGPGALPAQREASDTYPELPDKAVVLTFDGGYASFYASVMPLLDLYGYPAVVSVCTSWIEDGPPVDETAPVMTWQQVREVVSNRLFTVGSFSHALHHRVALNPQGDTAPAANTLVYRPEGGYESVSEFRARIAGDLARSRTLLEKHTGRGTQVLAWPMGVFNAPALAAASEQGYRIQLGREVGYESPDGTLAAWRRWSLVGNPDLDAFAGGLYGMATPEAAEPVRGVTLNLDLVLDANPVEQQAKLDEAIARVLELNVNTVYVRGYSDPERDGNIKSVYFPNARLPVKADLLSHVVEVLHGHGLRAHVVMPVLEVTLPDSTLNRRYGVREYGGGTSLSSTSWSKRLSPFAMQSVQIMTSLYASLAGHVRCEGIVFGEDAFLTDQEDFNEAAIEKARQSLDLWGQTLTPGLLDQTLPEQWAELKVAQLNRFTEQLMQASRRFRPDALFTRRLFAPALHRPESRLWLAQDYERALELYDRVMILAQPELEDAGRPRAWLAELVGDAARYNEGLPKTVFEVNAYNSRRSRWIRERQLVGRLRTLLDEGALHVSYRYDDFAVDRPRLHDMQTLFGMTSP